jgi:hypothetical protein
MGIVASCDSAKRGFCAHEESQINWAGVKFCSHGVIFFTRLGSNSVFTWSFILYWAVPSRGCAKVTGVN